MEWSARSHSRYRHYRRYSRYYSRIIRVLYEYYTRYKQALHVQQAPWILRVLANALLMAGSSA